MPAPVREITEQSLACQGNIEGASPGLIPGSAEEQPETGIRGWPFFAFPKTIPGANFGGLGATPPAWFNSKYRTSGQRNNSTPIPLDLTSTAKVVKKEALQAKKGKNEAHSGATCSCFREKRTDRVARPAIATSTLNRHSFGNLVGKSAGQKIPTATSTRSKIDPIREFRRKELVPALQKCLRSSQAESVARCQTFVIHRCEVCGRRFGAVKHRCRHRLCPFCAFDRSQKLQVAFSQVFQASTSPKLLTLTVRNVQSVSPAYYKWLRGCFTKLRHRSVFKEVKGGVYSIETTYSPAKGFHAHIHCLLDSPYLVRSRVLRAWQEIVGDTAGVDIRQADNRGLREVLKYVTKVDGLIDQGNPEIIDMFLRATKGSRLVQGFGSFFGISLDSDCGPAEKEGLKCPFCGSDHLLEVGRRPIDEFVFLRTPGGSAWIHAP